MKYEDCKLCNACYKDKKGVYRCDERFNFRTREGTPISEVAYCSNPELIRKLTR